MSFGCRLTLQIVQPDQLGSAGLIDEDALNPKAAGQIPDVTSFSTIAERRA